MRTRRLTRPKAPILFRGGHRSLFALLVQLGNRFCSKDISVSDVGEIRIYHDGILWNYEIFGDPDLY